MTGPRRRIPPAQRLVDLSTRAYVAGVLVLLALLVLLVAVLNPGHRVGP